MSMDVKAELERTGSILVDYHFVYKSGKHGPNYINADPALPHTRLMQEFCRQMVEPFRQQQVDTVVAPATGGIVMAIHCALAFEGAEPNAVWADKDGEGFAFERDGFIAAVKGKKVLVVDDTMTNANEAGSVFKVCRLVEATGGSIVGVSLICNRCQGTAEQLGVPRLESLMSVDFVAYPADDCPLCSANVPVVEDIGHGAAYKQAHLGYTGGYTKLLAT